MLHISLHKSSGALRGASADQNKEEGQGKRMGGVRKLTGRVQSNEAMRVDGPDGGGLRCRAHDIAEEEEEEEGEDTSLFL